MPRHEIESHASAHTLVGIEAEPTDGAEPDVTIDLQAAGHHASTVITLDDARRLRDALTALIDEVKA